MSDLKAVRVKWEWDEPHDRWSCEENYTLPERRADIPSDYEMLAKWMISGGGSRMTIEFTGYQIIIEAVYEGQPPQQEREAGAEESDQGVDIRRGS
jgi:hypothetical protein